MNPTLSGLWSARRAPASSAPIAKAAGPEIRFAFRSKKPYSLTTPYLSCRARRQPSKLSIANSPAFETKPPTAPRVSVFSKKSVKLTLWPLVAATFFMVSGGTYGTEDIVRGAGYGRAILILLVTPILWSLPTAFMIGELSSALPAEGGYYAWVRRALGNFWGFQEAWLSLTASVFDMAIYPTLFVAYLARLFPWFEVNHRGVVVGLAVVLVCTG